MMAMYILVFALLISALAVLCLLAAWGCCALGFTLDDLFKHRDGHLHHS